MILGGLGTYFHVDPGILGALTFSLACFLASLWLPLGPWGDPGLGSGRKDTFADLW